MNNATADEGKGHPEMRDSPIGLSATGTRKEFDYMGTAEVPADR